MISILLNFLKCVSWASMGSILVTISCEIERNVPLLCWMTHLINAS